MWSGELHCSALAPGARRCAVEWDSSGQRAPREQSWAAELEARARQPEVEMEPEVESEMEMEPESEVGQQLEVEQQSPAALPFAAAHSPRAVSPRMPAWWPRPCSR